MAAVTQASHPHTYWVRIDGQEYPGLISKEDFRTKVLEPCINGLAAGKRHSNFRSRAEITAIIEYADEPPEHCPIKNLASWRHGLGRPGTKNEAHWVRKDGQLFKGNEDGTPNGPPLCAIEDYYRILTQIHHEQGHWGRIKLFDFVKDVTSTIKQDTVREFVKHCCAEARNSKIDGETARLAVNRLASARTTSPRLAKNHRRHATHPRCRASTVAGPSRSRRSSLPSNSHKDCNLRQAPCQAHLSGSLYQPQTDEEFIAALSEPLAVLPDQVQYPADVADQSNVFQRGFVYTDNPHDAFSANTGACQEPVVANNGNYADAVLTMRPAFNGLWSDGSFQIPLVASDGNNMFTAPLAVPAYDSYQLNLDVQPPLYDNNVNTFPAATAALPAYHGCQIGFGVHAPGFPVDLEALEITAAEIQASNSSSGPYASPPNFNGNDFSAASPVNAAFSDSCSVHNFQHAAIASNGNDPFAASAPLRTNNDQVTGIHSEATLFGNCSARATNVTPCSTASMQMFPAVTSPQWQRFYYGPNKELHSVHPEFVSGGIDDFMPSMSEDAPFF